MHTYFYFFSFQSKDNSNDVPVLLVANKTDQVRDCGISKEDGHRRYRELGCVGFKEISVRESIEQVLDTMGFNIYICNWKIQDSFDRRKCKIKYFRLGLGRIS